MTRWCDGGAMDLDSWVFKGHWHMPSSAPSKHTGLMGGSASKGGIVVVGKPRLWTGSGGILSESVRPLRKEGHSEERDSWVGPERIAQHMSLMCVLKATQTK